MRIKSLILLLLIPIITFCSEFQSHTLRDSTGGTVTYTQLNVENSIQNDVLINKVDSLIKAYNNDTTYYVIQTFIDKELPLYNIQSANPVGKDNIDSLLKNYLKHK